jgi:sulfite exporter TauE/SafE
MCGPLAACFVGPVGLRGVLGYQLGRLGSYAALGALAGGAGRFVSPSVLSHLSWVGAGVLVLAALGVWGTGGPGGGKALGRLLRRVSAWGVLSRGLALGSVTALLPCGVLASAALVALATARARDGALVMGTFVVGTLPLLLAGQLGWGALVRSRWGAGVPWLQRAALGVGALTLVYRGWALAQGEACH